MGSADSRKTLLFYTVIVLFATPHEYLQIPILTSAMVIQPQVRTVYNNDTNNRTYTETEWAELKQKCRFGHLLNNGECRCRNAQCTGFENVPLCMARDSGKHRTWPNSCYMIEHACNARKKRLYYWKGECVTTQEPPREVAGEYCEGDDVSYCKNDGMCKYYSAIKERHCICKPGYEGLQCEVKSVSLTRRRRYNKIMRKLRKKWLKKLRAHLKSRRAKFQASIKPNKMSDRGT